ncbi:hypothetical protein HDU77_008832 [Chytriomyces hyalinus]|nr:hypothetical protein HDU77_008832 [Chytriomyces hyalinus]
MAGLALLQDSNTLLSYLAPIDQNNINPDSLSRDVYLESRIATLHLRSYLEFLLFCRTGCPCTSGKPCLEALKNWTLHHAKNLIDAVNAHLSTCSRQLKSPDEASTTPLESALKDLLELFTVSVILGLQIIVSDPSNHSNRVCAVTLQLFKDISSLIATNLTLLKTVRTSGHIKLLSKFYGAAEALADYPESLYIARRVLHAVSLGVKRGGSNTMDVYSSEWEPSPREAVQLLALSEKIPSLMRKIEERMKGFRDMIRHEPVVDGWVIPTPYLNKRASRISSGFPTTPLVRRLSNRPELETNLFPLESDEYDSESDNPDSPHLKRHKKLEGSEAMRCPLEVEIVDPLPITEIDDMLAVGDIHAVD